MNHRSIVLLVAAWALCPARDAHAQAGASEWSVVAAPAVATFHGLPGDAWAPLASGLVSWGLNDTISLGAQLYAGPSFQLGPLDDGQDRSGVVLGAFAGVGLNLDVTHIVPFGSVMAGVWRFPAAQTLPSPLFAIRVAVGFDVRRSRSWAWGVQVEGHVAPVRLDALPAVTIFAFRLNRIFDPNAL
jgi:hypothetical protein